MLSGKEIDLVNDLYNSNKRHLIENTALEGDMLWKKIYNSILINHYKSVELCRSYEVINSNGSSHLIFLKNSYEIRTHRHIELQHEVHVMGVKKLNQNYGNIFIRPETLEDKINEFFTRKEIDYKDYPVFSSKYYLEAENEQLCKSFCTDKRLKLIEAQKEIVIQVHGNLLLTKLYRPLNQALLEIMIDFLKEI